MCDTVKYLHQIENLLFLKLLRGYLHNVFIRRNSFSRRQYLLVILLSMNIKKNIRKLQHDYILLKVFDKKIKRT